MSKVPDTTWRNQAIAWTNVDFNEALWHSPLSTMNFAASAQTTILWDEFEKHTLKITATSPKDQ